MMINRIKEPLKLILISIFMIIMFTKVSIHAQTNKQMPNIIIMFIDDMAYGDVGFNNSTVDYTPNFQYMAEHGIVLENFYVSQPVCTASRSSLLTGCYANRLGMGGAIDHQSKIGLNPEEITIADMLTVQGYRTAAIGKWHLGFQKPFLPTNHGFDYFYGIPYSADMWPFHPERPGYYPPLPLYENETILDTIEEQSWFTGSFSKKSIEFIKKNDNRPFFLYLAHPMPHVPLFVSEKFKGSTGKGLYADVIHEIDASVGAILNVLHEQKIEENTLFIVTSDNGPWLAYGNHAGTTNGLREGKGTTWEGGIRTPFVAYWKGTLPEKKRIKHYAMSIDMLPTLASITGATLPTRKIDGENIYPLWIDEQHKPLDRALFFYYHKNDLEAMRWKNWKLYFPHTYRTMDGQEAGMDGQPGKYKMVKLEYSELYNLESDPYEKENIIAKHQDIFKQMENMAENIKTELGDDLTNIKGKENRKPGMIEE